MQAFVRKTSSSETPVGARAALSMGMNRVFNGLPHGRGWASYPFNTLTLASHFQPIFCADSGNTLGYEGLLLAYNIAGHHIRPETVFALSGDHQEELFLDFLCRALHLRNAVNLGHPEERGLVFLNAYPQAAIEDPHHPAVFRSMMEFYGVNPHDVVVEILETGASDDAHLVDAAELYRRLGCRIAIDDFGVGYSNFERLWRLRPDFVKIDRSVLKSAMSEPHARIVFANMIRLVKSCGAQVIVEGIEERAEAVLALELGADYVQGYYFAKPAQTAFPADFGKRIVRQLHDQARSDMARMPIEIRAHVSALVEAANNLTRGAGFGDATAAFMSEPNAVRAYLLDESNDPSDDLARILIHATEDQAWLNLPTPDSGLWRLRNTVARALAAPQTVQVASPMMLAGIPPAPTMTLSYAFNWDGRVVVLCGDVLATDLMAQTCAYAAPVARTGEQQCLPLSAPPTLSSV